MQNFKDVCGGKEVWFEIKPSEGKKFLKWAKDLGCVWIGGKEIDPKKGVEFFHLSIADGKLAYVPIFSWVSKDDRVKSIKRYGFSDFIKQTK